MPFLPEKTCFDAVVVGSGATGGCAAQVLCEAGLQVAVVEAGPSSLPSRPVAGLATSKRPSIQARCSAYNHRTGPYFIDDDTNPYTTPAEKPFSWIRSRMLGGRTLLWAGQCYRMSDCDFFARNQDGYGENWPVSYKELAPFYAKVERLLEINGTSDAIPHLPDNYYSAKVQLEPVSLHMQRAFGRGGSKLIPARISVRTSGGESVCVRCGRANADCIEHASSVNSTLAAAKRTGNLTVFCDTMVRHLVSDREGNATAVYVIDRESHRHFEISGRMFFLCASTLESTRILLNSVSVVHPAGFGNSSGALGHYLMDHVSGISITASFRYSGSCAEETHRPVALLYIPRSQNLTSKESRKFLRGYGWQVSLMRADHFSPDTGPGCGYKKLKISCEAMRQLSDMFLFRMQAFGEMLPRFENYAEIDSGGAQDAWGVPTLAIRCAHGENEQAMAQDMIASAHALADALGASPISFQDCAFEPGLTAHEAGTCRMGSNPRTSVLNHFNQCHDSPNVFVTDGSSFTTQGTQNPTLTMMALTARACEYAIEQSRKYELKRRPA